MSGAALHGSLNEKSNKNIRKVHQYSQNIFLKTDADKHLLKS